LRLAQKNRRTPFENEGRDSNFQFPVPGRWDRSRKWPPAGD
jgi:hypothetical protein